MSNKKVIVYGTPTCPFCVRAKKFLEDNNIEFKNIDVSNDQEKVREMTQKSGQMGVPVIDIGGEIIVGFEKDKVSSLLGLG